MSDQEALYERIQREIGDLTVSISGLVDNFRKLQQPLAESHQAVPQATSQLDRISQQTEAVTRQILDLVERITRREEAVMAGLAQIRCGLAAGRTEDLASLVDDAAARARENLDESFMIMDALQFQDITAQQMDHAASILEDIQSRLYQILSSLGTTDNVRATAARRHRKTRAFDPHAHFTERRANQEDIDTLFSRRRK